MPADDVTCDVLVVGAGPTGLMVANWLLRLGLTVTVVDGKSGPTTESRAMVLQARTMEIYDQLGVVGPVLAAAERAEALAPGFEKRVFGRVPLGAIGSGTTPYPWIYVLEQSRNEQILYARLRGLGGEVRWGHRLIALADAAGGVAATIAGPGGDSTVRARFCVGADGSSSAVRQLRGIAFEGVTNAHTFYVVDATGVAGTVPGAVNVRPGARDFLLAFPMAGRGNWRLIGVVRDENADGKVTEDDVRRRLHRVFAVTYGPSRWFATYRVHHRVAATFRDGPVFLAGDAAHVHSPVGAQGMNTGLQDAHNLAFKLADAVHRRAGDGWLDRYEAERRPVARRLITTTDWLFGLITSERRSLQAGRRLVMSLAGPLAVRILPRAPGGSRIFQYLSQTRIHYWMSADARRAARGRRGAVVGRRLPWVNGNHEPLRSLQWQVHAYGGVAADRLQQRLDLPVHVFPPAPGTKLRPGRVYLVRPDGFVAADATPEEAPAVFRSARSC
jgi:2-polyprenyl-6-methoxyphenol hydroxylase-like FAD-dependent oxidoreductase